MYFGKNKSWERRTVSTKYAYATSGAERKKGRPEHCVRFGLTNKVVVTSHREPLRPGARQLFTAVVNDIPLCQTAFNRSQNPPIIMKALIIIDYIGNLLRLDSAPSTFVQDKIVELKLSCGFLRLYNVTTSFCRAYSKNKKVTLRRHRHSTIPCTPRKRISRKTPKNARA